jgi:uncharacterized protein (DUF58 family)
MEESRPLEPKPPAREPEASRKPSIFRRRRSVHRRQGRLTREGKAFVLVCVGVGIAAVNTGNNLLYLMLGLMLSLLLLSMVLSEVALWRVRAVRRLPDRAFAKATCLIEITLKNDKKWMPSYSLEVEDQAQGQPTERRCYFLKIGARSEQTAAYRRTPVKRGLLELKGFRIATRYPFGLVEKVRLSESLDTLLVYPEIVEVEDRAGFSAVYGTEAPSAKPGPGSEVAGLREYRQGDDARAIHWRRTAALARPVVRERERDAVAHVTIVIDNHHPSPDDAWRAAFERAISRAASLAKLATSRGAMVEVVATASRSGVVHPGMPLDRIWRFLALLDVVSSRQAEPSIARGAQRIDVAVEVPEAAE